MGIAPGPAPRRTKVTVELTVETTGLSDNEHNKRVRWAYRNMLSTNSDMDEVFYVAAVRDESGHLLEFSGAGKGNPSPELREMVAALLQERG